jgi:hypothetical protein
MFEDTIKVCRYLHRTNKPYYTFSTFENDTMDLHVVTVFSVKKYIQRYYPNANVQYMNEWDINILEQNKRDSFFNLRSTCPR